MDEWSQLRQRRWSGNNSRDAVFAQLASVGSEPSGVAQDIGFPPWQAAFIQTGLENSNFKDTPPDTSANLNNTTNKLPGWFFTQRSGTAITAKVVADAASGSGYVVRFDVAAGAASDESDLEQIVSVSSGRGRSFAYSFLAHHLNSSATNSLVLFANAQFLKADGSTTTGTSNESTATFNVAGETDKTTHPNSANIPSDAAFLRVRIGVRRGAATDGTTGTQDFTETWIDSGSQQALIAEQGTPGTYGPGRIVQQASILIVEPDHLASTVSQLSLNAVSQLAALVAGSGPVQVVLDGAAGTVSIGTGGGGASLYMGGQIYPPQITGNVDNYNPTGLATASVVWLDLDAAHDMTGLVGGAQFRTIWLMRSSTQALTLKHESASSTAANRFSLAGAADVVLRSLGGVQLFYDSVASRWRAVTI